ncbi:MAG: class I SAM-dependent methyltransferase [Patescibacteria group bacterium]
MVRRVRLYERCRTNASEWYRWVFDNGMSGLPATARILDVGCGCGIFWLKNADRVPKGWDIALADISRDMASCAKRVTNAIGRKASVLTFDIADIQFPDAAFDVVLATHVLHRTRELPRALKEIRRVLKPDGRFCTAAGTVARLKNIAALGFSCEPAILDLVEEGTDAGFTAENGREMLLKSFRDVRETPYHDSLAFENADDLLAYLHSTSGVALHRQDAYAHLRLRVAIDQFISQAGAFRLVTDNRLFLAKP